MIEVKPLTRQLTNLEAARQRYQSLGDYSALTDFRVMPTCPPSTSVIMRQGKLWNNTTFWWWIYYNVQVPSQTCDFTDGSDIWDHATGDIPFEVTFSNANYYVAIMLGLNVEWLFDVKDYPENEGLFSTFTYLGGRVEYQTTAEAEQYIDSMLNGAGQPFYWRSFPLSGVVLRNNGTIGSSNEFLPIEPQNRGRSYLYRDMRLGVRLVA